MPSLSLTLLTCLPLVCRVQEELDALPEPQAAITQRELRHHLSFLASDELRGRAAGSPQAHRAARYLARALAAAGAAPAGDGTGYLQAMTLVSYEHTEAPRLRAASDGDEELVYTNGIGFQVRVSAAPVSSPVLQVLHVDALEELPREADATLALFIDSDSRKAFEWLEASGSPRGAGWGLLLTAGRQGDGRGEVRPSGRLRVDSAGAVPACDVVSANGGFLKALRSGEIETVQLTYQSKRVEMQDYNVIGRIAGVGTSEQPELASECIVFSAHYDHIGVARSADQHAPDEHALDENTGEASDAKDWIYNGADDDASGTAAVLELAQAFAAGPAPARSLIFLLAAGEEVGLLGTNYYLEHPAHPLAKTVANLNFEMIGRPDELVGGPGKLWLTGFERTTLGPAYLQASLDVVADPRPAQQYFRRSDNYAFAVRGIVGQTLSSYNSHSDYHQVSDELETIDFGHMELAMRQALKASQMLADGSLRPEWLPGGKP